MDRTAERRASGARPLARLVPILGPFLVANILLLVLFADRDGYEGDDLNSILPMAHLGAAKSGLLLIYRYAWQPLSYEAGALLWRLFGTPTAVFLSAPVAGAIALTGLLAIAWTEDRPGAPAWKALVALLGVPEFWFSSLYYNSTIIGLPAATAALLLLRRFDGRSSAILAGLLTGLAVLTRMDFILICPLLAVAAWTGGRSVARPVLLAGAVVAVLLAGWALGLIQPHALAAIQAETAAEIQAKAHMPGWNARMKLGAAAVSLSPIGWLLLVAGTPLLLAQAWRQRRWSVLLWPAAALPVVYPLLNMLSPKYILPGAIFLPMLFVHAQTALLKRAGRSWRRAAAGGLAAVALLPVFVSVSLYGRPPFLMPGLLPSRPVGTHDGDRGYGGYVWLMAAINGPAARKPKQEQAAALLARLRSEPSLVIAGGENFFNPGGVAWRHLQLILEREGTHGTLVAPHQLRFVRDGHVLLLADSVPRPLPTGAALVDLTGASGEQR